MIALTFLLPFHLLCKCLFASLWGLYISLQRLVFLKVTFKVVSRGYLKCCSTLMENLFGYDLIHSDTNNHGGLTVALDLQPTILSMCPCAVSVQLNHFYQNNVLILKSIISELCSCLIMIILIFTQDVYGKHKKRYVY